MNNERRTRRLLSVCLNTHKECRLPISHQSLRKRLSFSFSSSLLSSLLLPVPTSLHSSSSSSASTSSYACCRRLASAKESFRFFLFIFFFVPPSFFSLGLLLLVRRSLSSLCVTGWFLDVDSFLFFRSPLFASTSLEYSEAAHAQAFLDVKTFLSSLSSPFSLPLSSFISRPRHTLSQRLQS